MPEGFSFNREFDFVRLDGLRRATGRPPHEWDIYIIKELIDNALDADDALWGTDNTKFPEINIRIEYVNLAERNSSQLFIQVSNRAVFPVHQIDDIFATQWYTSRKAFIKGLTRGALGNALKTLLGIPYALRNRVAGDWNPDLKPLSLLCGEKEYLPRYKVDSTAQTIQVEREVKVGKHIEGTVIKIGLDHFSQEVPRTLADIQQFAEQYHLCNPHALFNWKVELGEQEWEKEYINNTGWIDKFQGKPPLQWYSLTDFQDLLGALYRTQCGDKANCKLSLDSILTRFVAFDKFIDSEPPIPSDAINYFKQHGITSKDIDGQATKQLYNALCKYSPSFNSSNLGAIGPEHIKKALTQAITLSSEILYGSSIDTGADPNIPFVIEAAVASLKEGKRQIWTAINYTSSYGDPFHSRWLKIKSNTNEPVLGLRGLLDAYDLHEDTPVVLFLHLICPNIEHHEFSKTEIDHLPFKEELSNLLDRLLTSFRQAREEEELRLEQTIFQALDSILTELSENERFVYDQLLEKLRVKLSREPTLAAWLQMPDAHSRLQAYINNYQQNNNTVLTHRVARSAAGTLSIPLHPERHFSVLAEHLSRELLDHHQVNKLLYVQGREFEPVIIENGWLCTMDMALLHNPPNRDGLRDAIVQCVVSNDLPVLVLHDADDASRAIITEIQAWLEERQLDINRIVDLGLKVGDTPEEGDQPVKLAQMMPGELAIWLKTRFEVLGIRQKSIPSNDEIRRNIRDRFEQLFLGHLWEGMSQQFEVVNLLEAINKQFHFTSMMMDQTLDEQVEDRLVREETSEAYTGVLENAVREFFMNFMMEYGKDVHSLVQMHMEHLYGRQTNAPR